MLKITEVTEGKSYACKFSITTACDNKGNPTPNLSGNTDIQNQTYTSLGIIVQRDLQNNLVRVIDNSTKLQFIVSFDNIWDIDDIEWIEEST